MDRRQLLFGMSVLAVGGSTLNDLLNAQTSHVAQGLRPTGNTVISDRERAGFRGPVRTVSVGSNKSEYDPAGRLITNRWLSNPDSEASETIRTLTYDGSGRLLTETVRTRSGILSDKVYSYDDKGRLLGVAQGSGDHTSFQYDEQGHKIEICDVAPNRTIKMQQSLLGST